MPKRKHLKDTQWTRNIVCNHQQTNSRLIDQEDIFFSYRWENYQLWWKNILMMKMIITVKIIFITSSKWLESTLKRNQSMNELFIKSFINDIDWRIIKEEKSWSYAWRFYHKTLRMVQESFITIQDLIWENIIQSKKFWLRERFLCSYKDYSGSYKVKRTSLFVVLKITNILELLSCYLLTCFLRRFQLECSWQCFDLVKLTKTSSSTQRTKQMTNMNFWAMPKISIIKIKNKFYSLCLIKRRNNLS